MKRVGIVGLGKMGILHAGIVNQLPDSRIQAVCEKEKLVSGIAKKLLPKEVQFYNDHVEMVTKENLDAVFITTPIGSHTPIIVDLTNLKPDLSLFVEKPLARSTEMAKTACEAVGNLSGVHMVGFQKRFSPLFRQAKRLIDQKSIGELKFFRSSIYSSDVLREGKSWRSKGGIGGVLLDLAPHLLDIILWFFGDVQTVSSVKRRRIYSKLVDDFTHARFEFGSGLSGLMDTNWSASGYRLPEIALEIYGKDGVMTLTDDELKIAYEGAEGRTQAFSNQSFDTSVPFLLANPEYTMEDQAFLGSHDKRTNPSPDFFEAARVNFLIDRIQTATEESAA
ncbi:MAG: Gfo/Idh/MocA family oxidoreductase [Candidatus Bathyarchaeia archaeon]